MISTERVTADDRQAIEALLEANNLPLAGLDLGLEVAVVARDARLIVGCAGVEPYGSAGLLRSVEFTEACPVSAAVFRKRI